MGFKSLLLGLPHKPRFFPGQDRKGDAEGEGV